MRLIIYGLLINVLSFGFLWASDTSNLFPDFDNHLITLIPKLQDVPNLAKENTSLRLLDIYGKTSKDLGPFMWGTQNYVVKECVFFSNKVGRQNWTASGYLEDYLNRPGRPMLSPNLKFCQIDPSIGLYELRAGKLLFPITFFSLLIQWVSEPTTGLTKDIIG